MTINIGGGELKELKPRILVMGIGGADLMDKGYEMHCKIVFGAIGFGTLKLAVHKACIKKLFESNDQLLDAEEIFDIAKSMA